MYLIILALLFAFLHQTPITLHRIIELIHILILGHGLFSPNATCSVRRNPNLRKSKLEVATTKEEMDHGPALSNKLIVPPHHNEYRGACEAPEGREVGEGLDDGGRGGKHPCV